MRIARTLSNAGAIAGLVALSALAAFSASATPGSGFVPAGISKGLFEPLDVKADKSDHWDLFIKSKADSDIGVDRLTVMPGGYSGWHTHAGATLVTVTSGAIDWYDGGSCSKKTYRAGQGFVEPANVVHNAVNSTGATTEFIAVQIRPTGTPPRLDAPAPNCPSLVIHP